MKTFTSPRLVYAFLFANLVAKGYASGFGASHCMSGTPPWFVSAHGPSRGGLSSGNLGLNIDGVSISSGSTASLPTGKTHTLTLSGSAFMGFLFRLSGKNGENVKSVIGIESGSSGESKINTICTSEIGGITHTNAGSKSSISITMSSDDMIDTTLDVTVVVSKDLQKMYYEAFDISFFSDGTVPTPAPTQSPTSAPSQSPTAAPTSTSQIPSITPSTLPSTLLSQMPSMNKSSNPSNAFSESPSVALTDVDETHSPSKSKSNSPSESPLPSMAPNMSMIPSISTNSGIKPYNFSILLFISAVAVSVLLL